MTFPEVLQQFADLKTAFGKASTDVSAYVKKLKDQVASGIPVTQEQLDALGNSMGELKTQVTDFDIQNSEPPTPVTPLVP